MTTRYVAAAITGSFVTLGLFYVMQALISLQPGVIVEPLQNGSLIFTRLIEERPVEKELLHRRFEDLRDPVEPTPTNDHPNTGLEPLRVIPKHAPTQPPTELERLNGIYQDGPLVAIVRVKPVYPVRATTLGLEGYVIVQFDVGSDGSVHNISIVESTHRVFEKAAINAAKKFRFKARVVDGVPQPSRGIRNLFRFELSRG